MKRLGYYTEVTIRLELPEGYFHVPDIRTPDWILMGLIGVITLAAAFLLTASLFTIFLFISLADAKEPMLPWFTLLCTFILGFCSALSSKRTQQGSQWLGKVQGFRNFILKAEKERLKMLVDHNPDYFYHILPYAYVLGISDQWIKNFEALALAPPNWYSDTDSAFSTTIFMHSLNSAMTMFTSSMTSSYSSSSSDGGSSGGGSGFSGGGSSGGGGGGGSW